MDQDELNKASMNEWEDGGVYEEQFRLRLTAKHRLVVGKWEKDGEWGVDLRRWSLDQGRLLATGITLNSHTWGSLYDVICGLEEKGLFSDYGSIDAKAYQEEIRIEGRFSLCTGIFDKGPGPYLQVTLKENGEIVWKARWPIGTLIRFDTIPEFIAEAQRTGLGPKEGRDKGTRKIDPETGREIF